MMYFYLQITIAYDPRNNVRKKYQVPFSGNIVGYGEFIFTNVSQQEFEDSIKKTLDLGIPVFLSCEFKRYMTPDNIHDKNM